YVAALPQSSARSCRVAPRRSKADRYGCRRIARPPHCLVIPAAPRERLPNRRAAASALIAAPMNAPPFEDIWRPNDATDLPCQPGDRTDRTIYTKAPPSTECQRPSIWGRGFGQRIDNRYQAYADPRTTGAMPGFQAGVDLLR